jgi:hydrogenase-4 component F
VSLALILFPVLMAALAVAIPSNRWRPWLLPLAGTAHLAMTAAAIFDLPGPAFHVNSPWLALDPPGQVVLLLISALFFFCSIYTVGYLRHRQERSNRVFCACLLIFLGGMSLVTWSNHLGIMWVSIEATALMAAPLIYFKQTTHSYEATWKYLLVGSVGIALALLGSFFLAYASVQQKLDSSLMFEDLLRNAPYFSKPWLRAAFVLLLVGYGTKMGLAPTHTWKPDAYGEAPGVVAALLAGGMTSCAFLAILRVHHVCVAAGEGVYSSRLLIVMGLLSMAVAGVFMIGQRDFKRMLAYSSVEHMGILVLGVGIGGPAIFGALLHLVNNGLTKGALFLAAGNIQRGYGSKTTDEVRGVMRRLPFSGTLFLTGFLAITGSPPFGPFISEFAILNGAFDSRHFVAGGLFLAFLLLAFLGMGATVLHVVQGRAPAASRRVAYRDSLLTCLPPLAMLTIVLMFGLFIPDSMRTLLSDAAHFLEVKP